MCGAYDSCNVADSPPCGCLDRFVHKDLESWRQMDWSGWAGKSPDSTYKKKRSQTLSESSLLILIHGSTPCITLHPAKPMLYLPFYVFSGSPQHSPLVRLLLSSFWISNGPSQKVWQGLFQTNPKGSLLATAEVMCSSRRMSLAECEAVCTANCSCAAYARLDVSKERSGCLFYYGDLLEIRVVPMSGQHLYIKMSSTESGSKGKKRVILIPSFASVARISLFLIIILFCTKRMKNRNKRKEGPVAREAKLSFFNLSTILKATNHFSMANKLGERGFGPVNYRGMLEDEHEIAVKCLAKNSSQGVDQLILIAKLQHRNLVRLLGGCIERGENMLIYEYMPNSSLDSIIFHETKSRLLDWGKRYNIINGIAKGLLYLHQDSRLRIIHQDLKASNILLDADMNPKISDFGLPRSFGGNETEAQTRRVVGT
ncbi:G-type lectin S-receptor-like serine/threonine-protein kinase SD1-1 [Salvia miltiorrhiza]|uniref:G-type lectin S-receptor-like serine/threonine-protein kinase SD1-1 n=1 Tax=Salvia miltiorrhiza TaxID=226208 RepID=UPI0025AD9067|nr:G-type lectin S-receptor-like serine/threonine-protein kinase SD1-1 [Salvia miltiorrhiza]